MGKQCIVGLDIGGTNCRIGLVDEENTLYYPQIQYTAELAEYGSITDGLQRFIWEYRKDRENEFEILAVSIGFPSTIDKARRTLISTPNIEGLDNVPIVELLEKSLGVPVFIDRDVNILMYHDLDFFRIPPDALTLGVYIGTGVGNAIYIDGKILLGKHGVAGELGHIPMLGQTKRCTCGNEACIEAYASGRYLEELCQEKFPGTEVRDIYEKFGESEEVLKQIEYMAIPIASEINILDPDYIILGGGLLQMKDFPKKRLEAYIYKHTRKPYPAEELSILYALSEQENGIVGAGIYGFRCLAQESGKAAAEWLDPIAAGSVV